MDSLATTQCAIMQLHARYIDAVWRKDLSCFGECFARDAQWRLSGFVLDGSGAITEFMGPAFEKYRRILLTFRPPIVDVQDGRISARTYVFMTEYIGPPDLSGEFFDTPDFGPPPGMPDRDQPTFNRSGILGGKPSQ